MGLEALIYAALPSLFAGVVMAYFNRRQRRHDRERAEEIEMKRRETLLSIQFMKANAELSYAVAMAIKRGAPNGEIDEAIKTYEKAKYEYLEFLNTQASNHLIH